MVRYDLLCLLKVRNVCAAFLWPDTHFLSFPIGFSHSRFSPPPYFASLFHSLFLLLCFSACLSLSPIISCTVPQSVLPPSRVGSVNGSSVEVSWEEPAEVRGVIEKYVLKAYSRDRPSSPPISTTFPHSQHLTGKGHAIRLELGSDTF